MPNYNINKTYNGIELTFEHKPDLDILSKLKNNGWRWHKTKKYWYIKQSPQALQLAEEVCNSAKNNNSHSLSKNIVSFYFTDIFGNRNDIQISINGSQYVVHSNTNMILCIDCKKIFSIHATNCPFCGCPLSYTLENFYSYYKEADTNTIKTNNAQEETIKKEKIIKDILSLCPKIKFEKITEYDLNNYDIECLKTIKQNIQVLSSKYQTLPWISIPKFFDYLLNDPNFELKIDCLVIEDNINKATSRIKKQKDKQNKLNEQRRLDERKKEFRVFFKEHEINSVVQDKIIKSNIELCEYQKKLIKILNAFGNDYTNYTYCLLMDETHFINHINYLKMIKNNPNKSNRNTPVRLVCTGNCSSCERDKCLNDINTDL